MPDADPRAPLDPQVAALFALMTANRAERVLEPEAMREGLAALAPLLTAGGPEAAVRRRVEIPGPAGAIRAELYAPADSGVRPLVVFFHGGGYAIMSPETHDKLTRQISTGADCVVLSVDYRLAPEHRFPAPLDDCVAALRWAAVHAAELGADPTRIAVAGDSAGGNASAAVCLRQAADGERIPEAALLLCPWTDMALDSDSMRRFGPEDGVLDSELMTWFRDCYVKPDQHADPFASPLRGDLSRFPRTLLVAGGIDPLLDDGTRFAAALRAAGRDVELALYDGMPHDFMLFPGIDAAEACVERICAFLRSALPTAATGR